MMFPTRSPCALTAAWMEGVIAFKPGGVGGAIEAETETIANQLAQLYPLGRWTRESKPGGEGPDWQ